MNVWIVIHHHRHGTDAFPVFQDPEPSERQMIRAIKTAGSSYEYDENDLEPEWLEARGPYPVPAPKKRGAA